MPGKAEMPDIRLRFLSRTAAEYAIVDLHLHVARLNLEVPSMHMKLSWNGHIDLTLRTEDASIVFALQTWRLQHSQAASFGSFAPSQLPLTVFRK